MILSFIRKTGSLWNRLKKPALKPGFGLWLVVLLSGLPGALMAQYYNQSPKFLKANSQWAMGMQGGLDFSSGAPVPFVSGFNLNLSNYYPPNVGSFGLVEGAVSVADPLTGDLLFYTGGPFCWNANGDIMPNGDSLLGNYGSTTQGVCAVPMIDTPGKYFLFNLHGYTDGSGSPGDALGDFFYSVIDMSLDGGLGDIVPGRKNIRLYKRNAPSEQMAEGLIAIPGNNCDIWVIIYTPRGPAPNVFLSYHITPAGLDTVPVVSPTSDTSGVAYGMAVSPDRSMVAISADELQLYRFDPNTGVLSGRTDIVPGRGYVPAFSPDNTQLYYNAGDQIKQCEVGNFVPGGTVGTPVFVGNSSIIHPVGRVYFRLYRDTIYFTETTVGDKMGIIASPNNAGVACNVILDAITAVSGTRLYNRALPNEVVYPTAYLNGRVWDTSLCFSGPPPVLSLHAPAGAFSYAWDNGDTTADRQVNASGTYWLAYMNSCASGTDTFRVTFIAMDTVTDTTDVYACNGDSVLLLATPGGTGYLWDDGSTGSERYVTAPGTYSVSSLHQQDCRLQTDMFQVTFVPPDTVTDTTDVYGCDGDSVLLLAPPGGTGYLWDDGTTGSERYVTAPGTYNVSSLHQQDCRVQTDMFKVTFTALDTVTNTIDKYACDGDSVRLLALPGGTDYMWDNGMTDTVRYVKTPGTYSVSSLHQQDCRLQIDMFKVTFAAHDTVTNTMDIEGCDGDSVRLLAPPGGTDYLWDNGRTDTVRYVKTPGIYSVSSIRQQDCRLQIDMFRVAIIKLDVELGPDTTSCGPGLVLDATTPGATHYLWQDQSTEPTFVVKNPPGLYTVTVSRENCSALDSIRVAVSCNCKPFIPNTFSPNRDNNNDVFKIEFISCPLSDFSLSVYNRWGQRVFKTNNPDEGWDGTFNGKSCALDVYFYYLIYRDAQNHIIRKKGGDLTLVR